MSRKEIKKKMLVAGHISNELGIPFSELKVEVIEFAAALDFEKEIDFRNFGKATMLDRFVSFLGDVQDFQAGMGDEAIGRSIADHVNIS